MADPNRFLPFVSDEGKHLIDTVAVAGLLGVWVDALPHITSLLTLIWMGLRIYESPTVQRVVGRRKKGDE